MLARAEAPEAVDAVDDGIGGRARATVPAVGGGDDDVNASDLSISGTLKIETGAGDDTVGVHPYADPFNGYYGEVSIGKDLKIDTGAHDDRVFVGSYEYDMFVNGKLEIKTQAGDDYVYLFGYNGASFYVDKDVNIESDFVVVLGSADDDPEMQEKIRIATQFGVIFMREEELLEYLGR